MKRSLLILLGGVALALIAYGGFFFIGSAPSRCMMESPTPELAWLQKEFQLPDAELDRIAKLHETYLAGCAERCRQIDAKNEAVKTLLAGTNTFTPQMETALQEAAQLRAECQKAMLQHFYAVSQTMPPGQGRRYLSWVTARTLGSSHDTMTSDSNAAAHEHHHE